jgi:hypothetical protein
VSSVIATTNVLSTNDSTLGALSAELLPSATQRQQQPAIRRFSATESLNLGARRVAEANFWPTNTAWVTERSEIDEAARALWDKHQRAWSQRRGLYRLYLRHFPDVLEKLRECRTRVTVTQGEHQASGARNRGLEDSSPRA